MKHQLIELITKHNSGEKGLNITIPIDQYVDKIINFSTIVPYYYQGNLIGFISYYNNDSTKRNAFLTMILISKDFQGKGIGKLLLDFSIQDLKNSGFEFYTLEVSQNNANAISLYKSYGFVKKIEKEDIWIMERRMI